MNSRVYWDTQRSLSKTHPVNEDRMMVSEYSFQEDSRIQLLVVADGMGGLADGEKASANAVEGFLQAFYIELLKVYMNARMDGYSLEYAEKYMEEVMLRAVQSANRCVVEHADPLRRTGTTISAVCIVGDYAVAANVGDSPIYLYRKKKKAMYLFSTLQTEAEKGVEAGLYERTSPEYYANAHRLYCNLGLYENLAADNISLASAGKLEEGDIILLGSDGAFGRAGGEELKRLLDNCPRQEERFLLNRLFYLGRREKNDDQTAILYIAAGEED